MYMDAVLANCAYTYNIHHLSLILTRTTYWGLSVRFFFLISGRNYGPPGTKKLVYFIDDMNMPEVDTYGTVQPHTLIRQHLDYQHWLVSILYVHCTYVFKHPLVVNLCCRYDRYKLTLKEIHNVQYVACMNPTAGSFTINSRLQRHFSVFAVSFPGKMIMIK